MLRIRLYAESLSPLLYLQEDVCDIINFYLFNSWKEISTTTEKNCWKVWERPLTHHPSSLMLLCSNRPVYRGIYPDYNVVYSVVKFLVKDRFVKIFYVHKKLRISFISNPKIINASAHCVAFVLSKLILVQTTNVYIA